MIVPNSQLSATPLFFRIIDNYVFYHKCLFFVTLSMFSSARLLLEKLARLKQAKEEAEKEIAEYRAQLEREFQKKVSDVSLYDYI